MSDWREDSVDLLILVSKGEGIPNFRKDSVLLVLRALADIDRRKSDSKKQGFAYAIDSYTDTGLTKYLSLAEKRWNMAEQQASFQSPTPPKSAHKTECVISVELDKDIYTPESLHNLFQDYLVKCLEEPFGCSISAVSHVFGCWFDFHICYSANLIDIYTLFLAPEWAKDAVTKPISQFGKHDLSTVR